MVVVAIDFAVINYETEGVMVPGNLIVLIIATNVWIIDNVIENSVALISFIVDAKLIISKPVVDELHAAVELVVDGITNKKITIV